MALEINEIGIRMRVRDAKNKKAEEEDEEDEEEEEEGCNGPVDRARLVEECVQRVLKILQAQRGR